MSTTLPRRIEFRDLRPGDEFEIHILNRRTQTTRKLVDRVRPIKQAEGEPIWRKVESFDRTDGTSTDGTMTLFVERGQTGHSWVSALPSDVVVLLERGED